MYSELKGWMCSWCVFFSYDAHDARLAHPRTQALDTISLHPHGSAARFAPAKAAVKTTAPCAAPINRNLRRFRASRETSWIMEQRHITSMHVVIGLESNLSIQGSWHIPFSSGCFPGFVDGTALRWLHRDLPNKHAENDKSRTAFPGLWLSPYRIHPGMCDNISDLCLIGRSGTAADWTYNPPVLQARYHRPSRNSIILASPQIARADASNSRQRTYAYKKRAILDARSKAAHHRQLPSKPVWGKPTPFCP